ncbi:MAG: sigma-70 family RNA polymerase sigma factor [Gemmataceae bacterium]
MNTETSRYDFGPTRWSLVQQGQLPSGDAARNELLERYHAAIYRFLRAKLKDPDATDEVYGAFIERLLSNHPFLQRAAQEKGRFRHYLRRILSNLVIDYHRQRDRDARRNSPFDEANVAAPELQSEDDEFRKEWVTELMKHAWERLKANCESRSQPHYEVLLHKAKEPQTRSQDLADAFARTWGKPVSAANIRQMLHRGQEMLSDCFLEEIQQSLEQSTEQPVTRERLEQELVELGMLDGPRREALARISNR